MDQEPRSRCTDCNAPTTRAGETRRIEHELDRQGHADIVGGVLSGLTKSREERDAQRRERGFR